MAELSKLVTNTLVNFGNFFNYIILSPPLSTQEKMLYEKGKEKRQYLQKALLGGMSKIEQI